MTGHISRMSATRMGMTNDRRMAAPLSTRGRHRAQRLRLCSHVVASQSRSMPRPRLRVVALALAIVACSSAPEPSVPAAPPLPVAAPLPASEPTLAAEPVVERPIAGRATTDEDGDEESGGWSYADEVVAPALRERSSAIEACYQRELRRHPGLRGTLRVSLSIEESGAVTDTSIDSSELPSAAVAECIRGIVQALRLPVGPEGGTITVTYPLTFTPHE